MNDLEARLALLLNHSDINLFNWNNLLNFYQTNKSYLSQEEILNIYKKSENYRKELNKQRVRQIEIPKNGRIQKLTIVQKGLDCRKEEVSTDLYLVVDRIFQEQKKRNQFKKFTIMPLRITQDNISVAI